MNYANALALALACASFAHAAEPVRLDDLISEALANNREVLAAKSRYEAARQRLSPARSLPDPVVSVGYASNGGPLPGQGLGANPTSNIGLLVSQELPFPRKRQLRGDIASKEAEAEFQDYRAAQLSVRARVITAFHKLHHTYASLDLLAEGKENLSRLIEVSEARYTAGKVPEQDVFKAQTQLSLLETRIIQMRQDQQVAEAELNSLLNRSSDAELGEPMPEASVPLTTPLAELLSKARTAPALQRSSALVARSELSVNLARQELHPDYTVAAGYFNQGGLPAMYQLQVDVPIQLHRNSRQRPAVQEQVDLLAEARLNLEAARQSLGFSVREAYIAGETASRLSTLYADTILPQAQLTVDSSLAAYQNGAVDLLSVLNNIAAKLDVEEQSHEQQMNYAVALARLQELTGVDLTAGTTEKGAQSK